MKKNINLLLTGFLLFLVGLIVLNLELAKYKNVSYLPDNYEMKKETFTLKLEDNKKYVIQKAALHSNIILQRDFIGGAPDDSITIDIYHTSTSDTYNIINTEGNLVNVIFSNQLKFSFKDYKKLYYLITNSIKDKTLYNYNLLKYSKVVISGSEEAMSRIEIRDYDK